MTKNKCVECGSEDNLLAAKDFEAECVKICESCFNIICEGYELGT